MPLANGSISVKDYDDETGITHLNLQDIDPAGLNYGSVTQDLDEIKDAVLTIIIGVVLKTNLQVSFAESSGLPADQNAQRETKWLVTYVDETPFLGTGSTVANPGFGKTFTFEIPCANLTLLANNQKTLDLTTGVGLAFKTAIDPNIRSPFNRSVAAGVTAVNSVIEVKHVGRNS